MVDLDKGGNVLQQSRVYLGPSLGWFTIPTSFITAVQAGGTVILDPTTVLCTVNVEALVTIKLASSLQGPFPPGIGRQGIPVTVADVGGNASSFTITILPLGSDLIDGLTSVQITANFGSFVLTPLVLGGWTTR